MFWRLHKAIFDDRIEEARAILEALGDSVQIVEGTIHQMEPAPRLQLKEASLCITTLQDARKLAKDNYPSSPWLFYHPSRYDVSSWSAQLPSDISWLNRGGIFLPYSHIAEHPFLQHMIGIDNKIFIRPNSGNKLFTGFDIVLDEDFSHNLENQLIFNKPDLDTLCYITPYKRIDTVEWRFWICEKRVVAYTPYSWGENQAFYEAPQSIKDLADKLASSSFSPDYSYVADFVLDDKNNPYLIEVNATSTSGIYNVDLNKLLPNLRQTATREYDMEIDY